MLNTSQAHADNFDLADYVAQLMVALVAHPNAKRLSQHLAYASGLDNEVLTYLAVHCRLQGLNLEQSLDRIEEELAAIVEEDFGDLNDFEFFIETLSDPDAGFMGQLQAVKKYAANAHPEQLENQAA